MKRERLTTCLIGGVLAFVISFAGVMCIKTGFVMNVESVTRLALRTGAYCLLAVLCMTQKRGKGLLTVAWVAALLVLWRCGKLLPGVEAILYRISLIYNEGYGIGYIQWGKTDPIFVAPDLGLCLIALLVATVIIWTVCCRKSGFFGFTAGLLPLVVCLVVTYTVPENRWLFLLLTGLLILMLTHSVRRRSAAEGNRLTALLLVPAMLAVSVLFWAVPWSNYRFQPNSLQETVLGWLEKIPFIDFDANSISHSGNEAGLSSEVDLTEIGPQTQQRYTVMEVYAAKSGKIYLRGQHWDRYLGTQWDVTEVSTGYDRGWPRGNFFSMATLKIRTKMDEELLYFPYYPGKSALWTGNFQGGMIENKDDLISYEYIMYEFTDPPKSYSLTRQEYAAYRYLPEETLDRAKKHLEAAGVEPGMTMSEVVALVKNYVENSAEYSLHTQKMPDDETDFALWFLEESDTGYCVHFASAAAVLLRAAGIPARYVTGYMVDAEADTWVTVMSNKAHAWVEYKSAEGWQVLDATSWGEEPPDTTEPPPTTEPPIDIPGPSISVPPTEATDPADTPTETTPGGTAPTTAPTRPSAGKKIDLTPLWKFLGYLALPVGICGAVWGQFALRRGMRRKKMKTGHQNARALAMWRESLRFEKLLKQSPPESLLELAEKAKFSQHTLTDDELAAFKTYLDECNAKLCEKPWIWRGVLRLVFAV